MAIIKPENMDFSGKNLVVILSGLPGVGKTTLALSAPDVLLIDADEGLARVDPMHRKDASICKTYEDMLTDMRSAVGTYKTIVVDTGGALIDFMKDWAIRTEPKASKNNGGISLQGFGVVKTEFLRLFGELRKSFNVILLFHEQKDKMDEEVFYELMCEGSAKTLVWQPADLGAHMFIQNGERYLGFTPTANYNAKAAYGIKGMIKVPELKQGEPNDFLTKLFAKVKENIAAEGASLKPQQEAYDLAMRDGLEAIATINTPELATATWPLIKAMKHGLTSEKELTAAFAGKVKELGLVYDKALKSYVNKPE
jgi:hypothetical protein